MGVGKDFTKGVNFKDTCKEWVSWQLTRGILIRRGILGRGDNKCTGIKKKMITVCPSNELKVDSTSVYQYRRESWEVVLKI